MSEEMVDILDDKGNKTGQVLTRSESHAKNLWHPIIHLWIFNLKGEILMQRRSANKPVFPDVWDVAVGGHVSAGESPQDAVIKEAQEELGIKIDKQKFKFICKTRFGTKMPDGWVNNIFIWSYITKMDIQIAELKLQEEEVSGAKWFSLDELDKMLNNPAETEDFSPDIVDDSKVVIAEIRKNWGEL